MTRLLSFSRETETAKKKTDYLSDIIDIREYDIPYYLRVAIDKDIRVGHWYTVRSFNGKTVLERRVDLLERAEPVVLGFSLVPSCSLCFQTQHDCSPPSQRSISSVQRPL